MSSKTNAVGTASRRRGLAPCRLMANLVALIYNWWHLYVRPGAHKVLIELEDGNHHTLDKGA